ncbi:hypothetical protein V6Z11_D04G077300 [Gossypium hirsutum]
MAFQLKLGLIHLLTTFRGMQNENPHTHLKEFHMVCTSMKPQGVIEDQIARAAELRRDIVGIRQKETKSLYNY